MMVETLRGSPIRVGVRNDYTVIVAGVAAMLQPYSDQVRVVEVAAGDASMGADPVDVTLYDTFGQTAVGNRISTLVTDPAAGKVAIFTWNMNPALVQMATQHGAVGYLSKAMNSQELLDAIARIHRGDVVIAEQATQHIETHGNWPGKQFGLTGREADMLSLVTQGLTNDQIAELCFISINSVKTYIRTAYRKVGVTTRSEAMLWGVRHGLLVGDHPADDQAQSSS